MTQTQIAAPPPPPPPVGSEVEERLKEAYSLMKKHQECLPPELQTLVKKEAIKEGEAATTLMHKQVTTLGRARKELEEAHAARLNLHASWRAFLAQQVQMWQTYTENFQKQESTLADRVNAAHKSLEEAKTALVSSKKTLGENTSEEAMTISDEETETKQVSSSSAQGITDGMQNLTNTLESLRAQAAQVVEEEQKSVKRPRLASPAEFAAGGVASEEGQPPFPTAGHA